ncbi:YciI family protein [Boudabousia marimammalium]|uniref:YCII-related domain-containing protein n=1 Tax=Boudabousia marimammalium TaxID=156892 RepID=A0A1Q5PRB2_9ACTO|nr:YciI family protein [Boudabousia marimammalium]OKL50029.1 hypothetical protein BM477_03835 [Boudabousia marimammalium]
MSIYTVEYQYDPTKAAEMDEVRPDHRTHLRSLHEQGLVIAVGSWPTPAPGAYLFVEAENEGHALDILAEDPFLAHGFIAMRTAHPFNLVIGELKQDK